MLRGIFCDSKVGCHIQAMEVLSYEVDLVNTRPGYPVYTVGLQLHSHRVVVVTLLYYVLRSR